MGAAHTKEDGPQEEQGDIVEGREKGGWHVFEFHGPSAFFTLLCCLAFLAAAGIIWVLWQANRRHKRLHQSQTYPNKVGREKFFLSEFFGNFLVFYTDL